MAAAACAAAVAPREKVSWWPRSCSASACVELAGYHPCSASACSSRA